MLNISCILIQSKWKLIITLDWDSLNCLPPFHQVIFGFGRAPVTSHSRVLDWPTISVWSVRNILTERGGTKRFDIIKNFHNLSLQDRSSLTHVDIGIHILFFEAWQSNKRFRFSHPNLFNSSLFTTLLLNLEKYRLHEISYFSAYLSKLLSIRL